MWNPNWNLRTLVLSLRGFMTTQPRELGSMSAPRDLQRHLASSSRHWACPICGVRHSLLLAEVIYSRTHVDSAWKLLPSIHYQKSEPDVQVLVPLNLGIEENVIKNGLKIKKKRKIKQQPQLKFESKRRRLAKTVFSMKQIANRTWEKIIFCILISCGLFLIGGSIRNW